MTNLPVKRELPDILIDEELEYIRLSRLGANRSNVNPNPTFTSSTSGVTYSIVGSIFEGQGETGLRDYLFSDQPNSPNLEQYLLTADNYNTIDTELSAISSQLGILRNFDTTDTNFYRAEIVEAFILNNSTSSVFANINGIAEDATHLYIATTSNIRKLDKTTLEVVATSTAIRNYNSVTVDGTTVYGGTRNTGSTSVFVQRLNSSDLSEIDQGGALSIGTGVATIGITRILIDDSFIYTGINSASRAIRKFNKSDFSIVNNSLFTVSFTLADMVQNDTDLVLTYTNGFIYRILKSDGSTVVSRQIAGTGHGIAVDSDSVYYLNRSPRRVYKLNLTDLTDVLDGDSNPIIFNMSSTSQGIRVFEDSVYVSSSASTSVDTFFKLDSSDLSIIISGNNSARVDQDFIVTRFNNQITTFGENSASLLAIEEGHRINDGIVRVVTV